MPKPLPEGMEASLHVYCRSDKEDLDVVINLTGMKALPDGAADAGLFLKELPDIADDWRLMTRDEIADYKSNDQGEE